jgi:hypothetical protein
MPATKTEMTVTISDTRSRPNQSKKFTPPIKSVKKSFLIFLMSVEINNDRGYGIINTKCGL